MFARSVAVNPEASCANERVQDDAHLLLWQGRRVPSASAVTSKDVGVRAVQGLSGILLSRPCGNGWLLKRTMTEKNGV